MRMLISLSCLSLLFATVAVTQPAAAEEKSVLDVKMKTIDGKDVSLAKKYDGKAVLVVNVASQCGLTPQYEGLQALHEKYGEKGLAVLGFPCNQFGAQEPGTEAEIVKFCKDNYDVDFDMFSKIEVNGEGACDLYKRLTGEDAKEPGKISWNFEKFLIGKDGQVLARFAPRVEPDDPQLVQAIEKELAK
ncbi:MAG: glutathione peroxidase [Planctomycetes bacterium]|nr:glutathione peroxidase [Planctomycetota bacterium]